MNKIKNLVLNNYIPVLLTAFLMWAGWISLTVAGSANSEEVNRAQWKVIAQFKETYKNDQVLELKKQIFDLQEENREIRYIFLKFIVGEPPTNKELDKLKKKNNSLF